MYSAKAIPHRCQVQTLVPEVLSVFVSVETELCAPYTCYHTEHILLLSPLTNNADSTVVLI